MTDFGFNGMVLFSILEIRVILGLFVAVVMLDSRPGYESRHVE